MTNVIPFRTVAATHRVSGCGEAAVTGAATGIGVRPDPTATLRRSATANDDVPRDFASAMRSVEREIYHAPAPTVDDNDGLRHLIR